MKRRQQTTKQRENAHTERWLHVRIRIWTSGTPFGLWMALTLFQIKWSSVTPRQNVIISRDICLRRKKKERKKTFWHLGYWKQWMISDQVWRMGGGSLRHNTMNTTHPFLPVTQTGLPVAVPSPRETVEVEDPSFPAGVEEGHSYS